MISKKGFSMVEMMVTVVIVAVCLVMALRVFSVCSMAVSRSYNTDYAIKALDSVMNDLREKAVLERGLEIGTGQEEFDYKGRIITVSKEIREWESPTVKSLIESGSVEIIGGIEGDLPDFAISPLVEVELIAEWGQGIRRDSMTVKTLLPGKEDEYVMEGF
ncbi:MAG: prepilin-type N-terminal cleavage/methylation domain-containing protein [Candidatus Aadella gelida]|nr:prepilin-type N-terminal cleavage/methylation domain-containing protein [Candidatus Aadella gelida]